MIYRIRYSVGGGHVHCRLFTAPSPNQTFAKCGDFAVRKGQEFDELTRAMPGVYFIGDKEGVDTMEEACRP